MSLAKSPCPAWCTADHQRYRSHDRIIGTAGAVQVSVFLYDEQPAAVVLRNEPAWADGGGDFSITITAWEAPALAKLMRTLGHPEIARLVDQAIEAIKADPNAPSWAKYIGTGARP